MNRVRKKRWIAYLLLVSFFLSGYGMYDTKEMDDKTKILERETACLEFITKKMMKQGGIYTRYLDQGDNKEMASGHEVLAESEGLMLCYAVQRNDTKLYQTIKRYIVGVLEQENYLSYRVKQNGEPMKVNACIDDLRIIRGLYDGGDKDLALKYAKQLKETNFKKGLFVDYYTADNQKSGNEMTLCYGDLACMEQVAKEMQDWNEIRQMTENVILGGYLGEEFPFFETRYDIKKKKYTSEDIFMIESLLTAYHLAEVDQCPPETLNWIEENLSNGKIYGSYTKSGEPVNETESTAIYAICVLIGQETGNQQIVQMAEKLLSQFQVVDKRSEIYGAFGEATSFDVYSFDNLTALMAFATLATNSDEEETNVEIDTVLICSNRERNFIEPLLESCEKYVDFVEDKKFSTEAITKYTYLITTSEKVIKESPNEKKIFAIGTSIVPKEREKLSYQATAYLEFSLAPFKQTGETRKKLFYMEEGNGATVCGEMELAQGKKVPYSVVNDQYGYASYVEKGDLSSVALAKALQLFFGKQTSQGKFYVMIDEVYPFTNRTMLLKMGEELRESGIPYIVRVMPVYENLDYPQFHKWVDDLRYLQENGASIVLHDPVDVGGNDSDEQQIESKLFFARNALEHQGVSLYPIEYMPVTLDLDFLGNVSVASRKFASLPVDTILSFPVYKTEEEWTGTLKLLGEKWLTVQDYRLEFEEEEIVYENHSNENYEYREKTKVSMKKFFDKSNQVLLTLVGISVLLFFLILMNSWRIYKKKFNEEEK